uniref:Uncharacterized protein n=1 Tax=Acrobeloides nanus TaxID=290746 RepID=A0A914DER3_9BILA
MADVFAGKWVLKEMENMDAYLKHLGLGLVNTPTLEDGRLVEIKHGEKNIRVERYVEGNKLIMIMNCDGVVAKNIHERVLN